MAPVGGETLNTSFEQRIRGQLISLREAGLIRRLRDPCGVDLTSNDYLGLAGHPHVIERLADAVRAEGCGSTGSRLLRGHRHGFEAVERRFAAFKGTARALYFSSGYLANLAVLSTFPEAGDVVLSDERNHASLIDGMRLSRAARVVFPHLDCDALGRLIAEHRHRQLFVVTESLFSMDGDVAPLAEYARLCRSNGAVLIVDEAHAVGLFGARGSGLIEARGLIQDGLISINSAGKALGVAGAFVAGPEWAIEYLVQKARPFIFSTAPPPALAAAIEVSLTLVEREPWRRAIVGERARLLRAELEAGLDGGIAGCPERGPGALVRPVVRPEVAPIVPLEAAPIVPVIVGDNERAVRAAADLQAQGFDVRAIRPPTVPAGTARLRLSVNVNLAESTIVRAALAVAAVVRELRATTSWVEASS